MVVVEAICFVPNTPNSKLKTALQEVDDGLSASLGRPKIKFVERGGATTVEDTRRPIPWSSEVFCERHNSLVFQGRFTIEKEKKEAALAALYGGLQGRDVMTYPKKED